MATKAAAFQAWASGFGMPAYAAASVPPDAAMPYLTYSFGSGAWGEDASAAEIDLWYPASAGEAAPNAKAEQIGRDLGRTGRLLACEGGGMRILRGSPFWQAVADDTDVKRRYVNVDIEYYTND